MENQVKLICDVALFAGDKTLLVKYSDTNKYDLQKGWFIPDDALQHGEHPEEAAMRVLNEQLGLSDITPKLGFIESFTGNDKSWHVVFHFLAKVEENISLNPISDIVEYNWFNLNSLPERKEIAHGGWASFTLDELKNHL